ncbi:MAG: chemotaxis protein CheW [Gammaproteobacteria bacterium]
MADVNTTPLRDLQNDPFGLLQQMELRSRHQLSSAGVVLQDKADWVGIGCLLGNERYLIERSQVREVLMMPSMLTRVPRCKEWVAGLANLRGQLLPIIDLRQFLGAGTSKGKNAARVLVAENEEILVGIIVDEVFGFRRFSNDEFSPEAPETDIRCERYLDGACTRGADVWPVFNMSKLLGAGEFRQAAS